MIPLLSRELASWRADQTESVLRWVDACGFNAAKHTLLHLPGTRPIVLVGLGETHDRWSFSHLPTALPAHNFRLEHPTDPAFADTAAFGWALGCYQFTRYKSSAKPRARFCWPAGANRAALTRAVAAVNLARDLINTPANDLGPAELAGVAQHLATEFGAICRTIVGDELLARNYPLIHAVGRASPRSPRLIDIVWGNPEHPRVTLVGKGVCFDTGGLNIKASDKMRFMKLDMGGAAHALALGRMIMEAGLPVRLRVLVPAVENSIGGNAVRPLDIVKARNGLTVEIADTDAEGRLILADALCEAGSEHPDLIIDFATLTGSARVALGPDITALFANDDAVANSLQNAGDITQDPLWRMPLWQPYASDLQGKAGDLTNVADLNLGPTTLAGAIYAALFLERFVAVGTKWIHLDIMGWNLRTRPGRPEGGEAHALLATFHFIQQHYAGGRT
jgi:leucyl aminopeptidase